MKIEVGRIRRAVDEAEKVARVEIPEARYFVDDGYGGAESIEQKTFKLETHIGTFGSDVEKQVAGRRRRGMNGGLDRRKPFELLRSLVRTETIPEIAADRGNA